VPHHLVHAASAYYPSTFDTAGILVIDGIGEDATALLAYGHGAQIETLQRIPMPHSLGFLWEKFSKFLGFSEYDASKVMGLAGYGISPL
jgi:carbamoyltransferase